MPTHLQLSGSEGGGWGLDSYLGSPSGQTLRRRHGDPEAHQGELGERDARGEGGRPAPPAPCAPPQGPSSSSAPPAGPAGLPSLPPPGALVAARGGPGAGHGGGRRRTSQGFLPPRQRPSVRPTELGLPLGLQGLGGLPRARVAPRPFGGPERAGALGPGTGAAPAGGGGSCGGRAGAGAPSVRAWGAIILKNKGGRGRLGAPRTRP